MQIPWHTARAPAGSRRDPNPRREQMSSRFGAARPVSRAVTGAVMALLIAGSLPAQETRGRITGQVVGTSKAAVQGASVAVTDVARGTVVSLTTNEEGLFQANYLVPGTYEVSVEMAGFKKYIRKDVLVEFNETRDLAIMLEVGAIEEAVSVVAEPATINTSDANLGLTVDARRLADLPLIHGDPYKLIGLAAGLAHSGSQRLDRPYEPTHIVGF